MEEKTRIVDRQRKWKQNPFRPFDNAYDEAEYIASDIKSKKYQGTSDYGQCAVLYRTNAQSRLLEESFISEGIPYDVVGGVNFYARKEIKDLLAYLKTIDNGKDDLAVKRIINVPRRGIGAASVNKYRILQTIWVSASLRPCRE